MWIMQTWILQGTATADTLLHEQTAMKFESTSDGDV